MNASSLISPLNAAPQPVFLPGGQAKAGADGPFADTLSAALDASLATTAIQVPPQPVPQPRTASSVVDKNVGVVLPENRDAAIGFDRAIQRHHDADLVAGNADIGGVTGLFVGSDPGVELHDHVLPPAGERATLSVPGERQSGTPHLDIASLSAAQSSRLTPTLQVDPQVSAPSIPLSNTLGDRTAAALHEGSLDGQPKPSIIAPSRDGVLAAVPEAVSDSQFKLPIVAPNRDRALDQQSPVISQSDLPNDGPSVNAPSLQIPAGAAADKGEGRATPSPIIQTSAANLQLDQHSLILPDPREVAARTLSAAGPVSMRPERIRNTLLTAGTSLGTGIEAVAPRVTVGQLGDASSTLVRWADAGGAEREPGGLAAPNVSGAVGTSVDRPDGQAVPASEGGAKATPAAAPASGEVLAPMAENGAGRPSDMAAFDRPIGPSRADGAGLAFDPVEPTVNASSARIQPQTAYPPAGAQVALQIARSMPAGVDRFSVQLRPAELGSVEIQLDFERAGRVSALITVERPETLELLQRDSRTLERSLGDSGLKLTGDGLSFTLKQDQQHGQNFHEQTQARQAAVLAGSAYDEASETEPAPSPVRAESHRLLDIRT